MMMLNVKGTVDHQFKVDFSVTRPQSPDKVSASQYVFLDEIG